MDSLEIVGTWAWSYGLDEYAVKREIVGYFLDANDERPVPIYVTRLSPRMGSVTVFTARGDARDREAIEHLSDAGDLGLTVTQL